MARNNFYDVVRERLADEVGRIAAACPCDLALAYPSAYRVAMSSLGFQTIYRLVQQSGVVGAERVFAPDQDSVFGEGTADLSYEGLRGLGQFRVIAFSVAYELELGALVKMLTRSGIAAIAAAREVCDPLVIVGGPLTMSNPRVLGPFVDAIVVGEADETVVQVVKTALGVMDKRLRLEALSEVPGVWVPKIHGDSVPDGVVCSIDALPARAPIRTPHAELRNMVLIEAVRGCSRGCAYCVMRGKRGKGMRVVSAQKIYDGLRESIAEGARRIGLVGAGVSDHPQIVRIVQTLVEQGCEVGLSSLRAERLTPAFVSALRRGGYKTITTALDGASARLREQLQRRTTQEQLMQAAQVCRDEKVERLKLYLMVGVPEETDEDIDECAKLLIELSRLIPTSVGVAPFCAKMDTPLEGYAYAGIDQIEKRVKRLRKAVAGRAQIRATSARWGWVEHVLSAGGHAEGLAVLEAEKNGGKFADYRKAFEKLGHRTNATDGKSSRDI